MKPAYVVQTMEHALADVHDGIKLRFDGSALAVAGQQKYIDSAQPLLAQDKDDDWCNFQHRRDIRLAGTSDYVAEKNEIHRQCFGCEHLAIFSNTPGPTHRQLMDNFALYGKQIIPPFGGGS